MYFVHLLCPDPGIPESKYLVLGFAYAGNWFYLTKVAAGVEVRLSAIQVSWLSLWSVRHLDDLLAVAE